MSSTAEEYLAKLREQNKLRQKKYYAANAEAVNAKRRELYAHGRTVIKEKEKEKEEVIEKAPLHVHFEPEPAVDLVPEDTINLDIIELPSTKVKKGKVSLSLDDVLTSLKTFVPKASTLKKYSEDAKRLFSILDCTNLMTSMKKPKETIAAIENATQKNGKPYSVNTKKSLFQLILILLDHYKSTMSKKIKEAYVQHFEIYKIKSLEHGKTITNTAPTHTFQQYLNKVKNHFGILHPMFVLAMLYNEVTARDDFALQIVASIKETTDKSMNYIVVGKTGPLKVVINHYKTDKKNGSYAVTLSAELSKLIRQYMKHFNLTYGAYLFGNKKLSGFVSHNNRLMDINAGIDYYRHMKISDLLNKENVTAEERVKLAKEMKHSPAVQLLYLRKKNIV